MRGAVDTDRQPTGSSLDVRGNRRLHAARSARCSLRELLYLLRQSTPRRPTRVTPTHSPRAAHATPRLAHDRFVQLPVLAPALAPARAPARAHLSDGTYGAVPSFRGKKCFFTCNGR